MVNYQNGQIYFIKCNTTNLVYIGSTAQERLSVRIGSHRRQYKHYCNGKNNNCGSFKILENDNYIYETLEFYKCDNRRQLEERERFYIEDYKNKYGDRVVNKVIPTRTTKERYINNREDILTKRKEYYNNNREEVIAKQKEYNSNHKERRTEYNKEYFSNLTAEQREVRNKKKRDIRAKKKASIM